MTDGEAQRVRLSYRVVKWTLVSSAFSLLGVAVSWTLGFFWVFALCAGFGLVMSGIQLKLQRDVIFNTNAPAVHGWLRPGTYVFYVGGVLLFATGVARFWTRA